MDARTDATTGFRSSIRSHFGSIQGESAKRPFKVTPFMHTAPAVVGGTRSQFGSQAESFKRTSPSIGFGTGPRFKEENLFISKGHSKGVSPSWTPGPGTYKMRSSIGAQPESRFVTRDQPGFAKDDRFGPDNREARRLGVNPAPGDYKSALSSVGPQMLSKTPNAEPIAFGTASRDKQICEKGFETAFYCRDSPGPKYMTRDSAIGRQARGHMRTGASIGFTKGLKAGDTKNPNKKDLYTASTPAPNSYNTTERIGRKKPTIGFTKETKDIAPYVSLSKEGCAALLQGREGPGPGYTPLPSVGPQHETHKRNASHIGFTKASRFPKLLVEDTPGPGAYIT